MVIEYVSLFLSGTCIGALVANAIWYKYMKASLAGFYDSQSKIINKFYTAMELQNKMFHNTLQIFFKEVDNGTGN